MTRTQRGVVAGCALGVASGWNVGNIGAVASELAAAYGIGLATVGLFTTALFVTHTAIQVPGGRASDRFGPARAGAAALACIVAGDLLALTTPSPAVVIGARAITGVGTGLAFIAGSALVREAGGSAFAQGLFGGIGLGAGAGLALAVVPQVEDELGWRAPFWTSLAVVTTSALLLVSLGRGATGSPPRSGR